MLQLSICIICVPLFGGVGGGGGGSREVQTCRLSYLAFPAPIPFSISKYHALLRNLPLFLLLLTLLELHTPSLSSPAPYSSHHRSSRAPCPCPPALFPFLNFVFQTCCGEQAFHLGEVVIIKFLHRKAVTAHLQQFSLFKHAFLFQIL